MYANSLHDAAKAGDISKVKSLLDENPSMDKINARNRSGETPLHCAVEEGHKHIVELLLAHGVDVNARNSNKYSPLHRAALRGHKDVVLLLLANGADINVRGPIGETPLHWAANEEVAQLMVAHGAFVDAKGSFFTPLERAALNGRKDVVEFLLALQADINTRNHFGGFTPLHWAALRGHKDIAECLLAKGIDVNARGGDGSTPLHAAVSMYYSHYWPTGEVAEQSRKDVVLLLLAKGAHINAMDKYGETPLHKAAKDGHKHMVKLLRRHGALPRIITIMYFWLRTVFHWTRSR